MPTLLRLTKVFGFFLFLSGHALAQGDSLTFDQPVAVADDPETKAELEEALRAYKKRDFLRASLILHRVVARNDVAITPVAQKAEYTLGKTLYRLGLFQASVNFFDRVVQAGPEHRYFRATCKWLYYLSRKISGDPGLLEKIAKFPADACPAEFQSELAFLQGQYHYKKGAVETGLKLITQVDPSSRYFPKAKFLEGISHVRLDAPKPAVEAFKGLLRATVESGDVTEDLRYFNQLAILSMARVFYSTGQFGKAVKYYDRIPLDSTLWLDALFEASWTFFRMNNHEKALGNLHTLNSPFFADEYVPEGPVLKAVIFYSNCNYDKARDTINEFRLTYEPLRDEIKQYIDQFSDPTELYQFLGRLQDEGAAMSPRVSQILNAAFQDKALKRINAYVRELDREIDLIRRSKSTWARSQLAGQIVQETELIKSLAVHDAGTLAKQRLQRVVNELNDLVSQSLKIEFEIATAEKGILQNRLQGAGFGNKPSKATDPYAVDQEHIYWPFTGEYWRDELGYYLYTIKSECTR
jgi:tetratricopeptide (TPR) repeat protein